MMKLVVRVLVFAFPLLLISCTSNQNMVIYYKNSRGEKVESMNSESYQDFFFEDRGPYISIVLDYHDIPLKENNSDLTDEEFRDLENDFLKVTNKSFAEKYKLNPDITTCSEISPAIYIDVTGLSYKEVHDLISSFYNDEAVSTVIVFQEPMPNPL